MTYNRFKIFKRDGFRCRYCGAQPGEKQLHVDHVHPRSRGGTDDPLNLVTACRACNLSKRDHQIEWRSCTETRGGYSCKLYVRNQFLAAGDLASHRLSRETDGDNDVFWPKAIAAERQLFALWTLDGLGAVQCNPGNFGWWRASMFNAPCATAEGCSGHA